MSLLSFVGYRGDPQARAADLPHVDRRLVEIARALATRPAVLLLDEPAAGLSRADKEALAALMGRIAQAGVTVLLVEQNVKAALAVADRAAVLVEGRERIVAPCAELLHDARMAELYLGRHAAAAPALP